MAQECRYETSGWILGYFWILFAVGTLVLEYFDDRELLDIAITTLVPLVFLLSIGCPCLCKHAHNRGGGRDRM